MRYVLGLWGLVAFLASSLPAQTPDWIIDTYINEVRNTTGLLGLINDAHSAQADSPALSPQIAKLNEATARVQTLYGNAAAATALSAKSAAMSSEQAKLAAEQSRLTTGDCPAEGTVRSGNGANISPTVTNRSAADLRYYWLDYQGKRTGGGVLKPNETQTFGTYASHSFVFVNPQGQCVRIIQFTGPGSYAVSELLAPSVGPILAQIKK